MEAEATIFENQSNRQSAHEQICFVQHVPRHFNFQINDSGLSKYCNLLSKSER